MVNIPLGTSDFRRGVGKSPFIKVRNRYFEQNPTNLVEGSALLARPALQRWLTVGDGPNRGGPYSQPGSFNDALFLISDRTLYKVGTDFSVTLIGNSFFNDGDDTFRAIFAATAAIGSTPERLFIADGKQLKVYQPDTFARGELLTTAGIANNDVVRIGSVYYRFTNGSVNSGTPAGTVGNPWLVAHVADTRTNLENLLAAVNASGVAGTTYSTALTANASAVAESTTAVSLFVRASVIGTAGNSVVTTTTITGGSWTAGTLVNGVDDGLSIVDVPEGLAAISVAFIAGYVIVVPAPREGFKGRFYWIEPGEVTIDPINFATAERSPDPLVAVRTVGDQFALFGTNSTEMWYPTGDVLAPFARSQSRVFERGLWQGSDVQIKDTLVMMDTDGTVYRIDGNGPQRISDNSIEERTRLAIKQAVTSVGPPPPVDSALAASLAIVAESTSGAISSQTFQTNVVAATGGVAPYTYRWFWSSPSGGFFGFVGGSNTELAVPQVINVPNNTTVTATLNCEVTDSAGSRTLAIPAAAYSHQNTLPVSAPTPVPPTASFTVGVTYTTQATSGIQQTARTFNSNTATPSGGTGPYTYSWYFEDTSTGSWFITNPTNPTCVPSVQFVGEGESAVATLRCRVTDSLGAFGVSPQIYLSHSNQFRDFEGFIP